MYRRIVQHRRVLLVVLAGFCLLSLALGLTWWAGYGPLEVVDDFNRLNDALKKTSPWVMVGAICFLPIVGVPASPLFIVAGYAYGVKIGLLVSAAGLTFNIILCYFIARFFRRAIKRLLNRRGHVVPEVPEAEFPRLVLLVRLMPGSPLILQNYLLGLARTPFRIYVIYSLIVQYPVMAAYLLSGGSLFEGKWGLLFAGVCLLVVMALLTRFALGYLKRRRDNGSPLESAGEELS